MRRTPKRRVRRGRRRPPAGRRRGPPPCADTIPMQAPMSASAGLLCHSPSASITIGVAETGTLNWRSSASACASVSRSRKRNGMPLRLAKSRSRWASGEKREPMMRTPSKPSSSRSRRRARNALSDRLAQLRQLLDRPAQLARRRAGARARPRTARAVHQRRASGQRIHVAGELARAGGPPPCAACRGNAPRSRPRPSSTTKKSMSRSHSAKSISPA